MSNLLRVAVSKQKRRYQKNGYDLDLAYITDRVIAMGFPSEKVEGVFRNPMKEVQRFLDHYHKDHYRVYNLCSERDYDHSKFYGRVGCYPFDDHNAPQFELIDAFCKDVDEWMKQDEKNIIVVHCKAGKGRTGVFICCWLLYCGMWKNTEDSLRFYAALRTYNQKGVTIPSQIRYVHYFGRSLREKMATTRPLLLKKIVLKPLPMDINLADITFNVSVGKTTVYTSKDVLNVTIHRVDSKRKKAAEKLKKQQSKKELKDKGSSSNDGHGTVRGAPDQQKQLQQQQSQPSISKASGGSYKPSLDHANSTSSLSSSASFDYQSYYQNSIMKQQSNGSSMEDLEEYISFDIGALPLDGDVRFEVCNKNERMFMFWVNTIFVQTHEVIVKSGLDKAHKDKNHKSYPENFRTELIFDQLVDHQQHPQDIQVVVNNLTNYQINDNSSNGTTSVPPPQPSSTTVVANGTNVVVNHKDETDSEDDSDSDNNNTNSNNNNNNNSSNTDTLTSSTDPQPVTPTPVA